MAGPPEPPRSLADALVAFAASDVLGAAPDWEDVAASVRALRDDPEGARRLRRALAAVADPEIADTLTDWCARAAEVEQDRARDAHRAAEKLVQPVQMVALGAAATSAISLTGGMIVAPLASALVAATLCAYLAATAGRWALSRREDRHGREAERTRRLAGSLDR